MLLHQLMSTNTHLVEHLQAQAWLTAHQATITALEGGIATEKAEQQVQSAIAKSSAISHPGPFPCRNSADVSKQSKPSQAAPVLTDGTDCQGPVLLEVSAEQHSTVSPSSVERRPDLLNEKVRNGLLPPALTPKLVAQTPKSKEEKEAAKAQREAEKAAKAVEKAAAKERQQAEKRQRLQEAAAAKAKYATYSFNGYPIVNRAV
jgi:hypothetical protein